MKPMFTKRNIIVAIVLLFLAEGIYYVYYYYVKDKVHLLSNKPDEEHTFLEVYQAQFDATVRFKNITILQSENHKEDYYTAIISRSAINNKTEIWLYNNGWSKTSDDYEKVPNGASVYNSYFSLSDLYWDRLNHMIDSCKTLTEQLDVGNVYLYSIVFNNVESNYREIERKRLADTAAVQSSKIPMDAPSKPIINKNWNMIISFKLSNTGTTFNYVYDSNGTMTYRD